MPWYLVYRTCNCAPEPSANVPVSLLQVQTGRSKLEAQIKTHIRQEYSGSGELWGLGMVAQAYHLHIQFRGEIAVSLRLALATW